MKRDDAVLLADIIEAINYAADYGAGYTYSQYIQDTKTQDAIIRRLEIIGEAANNLSPELRRAHPKIEWGQIIGMRNRLIHAYARVDLDVV